jgi:hypothetical protein
MCSPSPRSDPFEINGAREHFAAEMTLQVAQDFAMRRRMLQFCDGRAEEWRVIKQMPPPPASPIANLYATPDTQGG